jgi:FKBP-type peptidyl-prolyl cis-trans isomerase FkpA
MNNVVFFARGIVLLSCTCLLLSGCRFGEPEYKHTPDGLAYRFYEQHASGEGVFPGDMITADVVLRTEDTIFFVSSRDLSIPYQFEILEPLFPGDIYDALMLMCKGDSATFILRGDSLFLLDFQSPELPSFIQPGTMIFMDIRLLDVMPATVFKEHKAQYRERTSDMEEERQKREQTAIQAYITANGITVNPSETGLYYIELKKGSGSPITVGKEVTVDYSAMFISGEIFETTNRDVAVKNNIFDSSMTYGPFRYRHGDTLLIAGWTEGLAYMREGGKARFILPSALAYGEHGVDGLIPPFMPLVYEVEIVTVK